MRVLDQSARWIVTSLAVCVVLTASPRAFAVELVRYYISVDSKNVLMTTASGHGEDADTRWKNVTRLALRPLDGYEVEPDGADPLRATLKGKVALEVYAGGRADVAELKLVREQADAPWKVDPADVERTLKTRHKPFFIKVSVDGKQALWTGLQTRVGRTADNPDNVWRELKRQPLRNWGKYRVTADADDPLRKVLQGNIVIEVTYATKPWGRAEVSELTLVRERAKAVWKLDPADVERTLKSREKP